MIKNSKCKIFTTIHLVFDYQVILQILPSGLSPKPSIKVLLEYYILLLQLKFPSSFPYSDAEEAASPTSQLLMEYEEHLRNTLEKDSESFSLQTFEALLSRSMENLGI